MRLPPYLAVLALAIFATGAAGADREVWRFTTPEPVLASPAIAPDGTVYVGSYDRTIYALTPGGGIKWTNELPPPIYIYFATYTAVYGTPAIGADGTLYVASENGKLLALDPANGAVKWDYTTLLVEGVYSSPAIAPDGTIYFGSYDANLYAIRPDGSRKWTSRFDSTIFASPAVGRDGTVYCGCDDGKLYALNSNNGTRKWTFVTGNRPIAASPAIGTNGALYVGVASASNPRFYSISTNGATNWVFTAGGAVNSSAAIGPDGSIYFGCNDGKLYALNPDGSPRWAYTAGGPVASSPAVAADGTIYFGCDDGRLYAVDAGGNALWTFQTGDYVFSSPAIGPDGTVYFASADGSLYLVRGCRPPVISAWPMFRQDRGRTGRVPAASSNRSPELAAIPDRTVLEGLPLSVTNTARDPDGAAQSLRFSLGLGAPAGAAIDPASGVFQWTPPVAGATRTNLISLVVTDDGLPELSDARCLTVVVAGLPRIEHIAFTDFQAVLRWQSIPGRSYRVHYKSRLDETNWTALPGDVLADADTASRTNLVGPGSLQRFYRVEALP
jgi:outer membrane protein assembly factor BamB